MCCLVMLTSGVGSSARFKSPINTVNPAILQLHFSVLVKTAFLRCYLNVQCFVHRDWSPSLVPRPSGGLLAWTIHNTSILKHDGGGDKGWCNLVETLLAKGFSCVFPDTLRSCLQMQGFFIAWHSLYSCFYLSK